MLQNTFALMYCKYEKIISVCRDADQNKSNTWRSGLDFTGKDKDAWMYEGLFSFFFLFLNIDRVCNRGKWGMGSALWGQAQDA